MTEFLNIDDLAAFVVTLDDEKAAAMIEDATALALLHAPCLADEDFTDDTGAVKAILRGAILRWYDAGSGALSAQTAGPFGQTLDTRPDRRGMFWPSEIVQLQSVCSTGGSLYTTSLAGPDGTTAPPWADWLWINVPGG